MTNEEKLKDYVTNSIGNYSGFSKEKDIQFVIDCVKSEVAKQYWQLQQAPDMEEVRKQYIDKFGNDVNFSGEDGDFNPKLLYAIFDFFAPMIKGSGSVVTVELLDKMIESEKYGAEEYIQDLGNSEGAERCFAKIEILEELKELFKQTKKG